jgi:sulfur carrier protein
LRIQVNGEPRDVDDGTTLSELISSLQLKPEQIAVELNRTVVRRAEWPATVLHDGDALEVVHFVGGGVKR